jgi:hypothetical protein
MYAAQPGSRQEEPGTSLYIVLRRVWAASIHCGESTLSAIQILFGGSQQPFDRLSSVAFYGVPIVMQTTIVKDTKIELRSGVTTFSG